MNTSTPHNHDHDHDRRKDRERDLTCRDLIEALMDYVDGTMAPDLRAAVQTHLGLCKSCVAYVDAYRRTIDLSKVALGGANARLPDDVPEGLIRAIKAARAAIRK